MPSMTDTSERIRRYRLVRRPMTLDAVRRYALLPYVESALASHPGRAAPRMPLTRAGAPRTTGVP